MPPKTGYAGTEDPEELTQSEEPQSELNLNETDPGEELQTDEPVTGTDVDPASFDQSPGYGMPLPASEAAPVARTMPGPSPLIMRGSPLPATPASGPSPVPTPGLLTPEQAANDFTWRRLAYQVKDLPLDQTEQAVSAALRYQGQRQYARDLASGVSPAEALARSAPLIFGGQKQGSLGQAAQFIHATRKPGPMVRDVGGVLYRYNQDGTVTALTPPKVTAPKINEFDKAEYSSTLRQIQAVQKEAENDEIGSPEFQAHQATISNLNRQLQAIRNRTGIPGIARPPAGGTGRIRVRHPDGRYGTIDRSQKDAAQKAGWTILQ
jgi:hypothetical protein